VTEETLESGKCGDRASDDSGSVMRGRVAGRPEPGYL